MKKALEVLEMDVSDTLKNKILALVKNMADQAPLRMPLRDAGMVRIIIGMMKAAGLEPHRFDHAWAGCLMNLARSETLHGTLRDSGILEVTRNLLLKHPDNLPSEHLRALLPLAHCFGSESSSHPAQQLLSQYDVSPCMVEIMEQAAAAGKAGGWSVEEAQHAIQVWKWVWITVPVSLDGLEHSARICVICSH